MFHKLLRKEPARTQRGEVGFMPLQVEKPTTMPLLSDSMGNRLIMRPYPPYSANLG